MSTIDLVQMDSAATPPFDVTLRYRRVLALSAVVLFFTNIVVFAFGASLTAVPPLLPYLVLAALSLPLLLSSAGLGAAPGRRAMLWACGYCALVFLGVFWSDQSDAVLAELRIRLLGAAFLVTMLLVFADARALPPTRSAIAACTIVAAVLNLYDVAHPHVFSAVVGRSAGLYVNPNISGNALSLGALISVGSLPRRWRAPFLAIVLAGVLLTVSRAAILCWVLVLPVLVARRAVSGRALLASVGVMAVAGLVALLATAGGQRIMEVLRVGGGAFDMWNRVLAFNTVVAAGDYSTEMRLAVARRALEMFAARPLLGYGTGMTTNWDFAISTHDIYLRHLAEYGIVGAVIYPSLVAIVVHGLWRRDRTLAVAIGLFLLTWGLFSHNVLDEWYNLLAIAYFLALGGAPADGPEGPGT